jgi:acyl-CoA thioester hydrolase
MGQKINIPTPVCFSTSRKVIATDINYGGHAGNERFLLFAQETRIAFLQTLGFSETAFGPYGLILAEAHIEYLNELFDEEILTIDLSITAPTRVAFECYYQIKTTRGGKEIRAANIRTNMVCFDYKERKVKSIPEDIKQVLAAKSQG